MDTFDTPWALIAEGWSAGFFTSLLMHYLVLTFGPSVVHWFFDA